MQVIPAWTGSIAFIFVIVMRPTPSCAAAKATRQLGQTENLSIGLRPSLSPVSENVDARAAFCGECPPIARRKTTQHELVGGVAVARIAAGESFVQQRVSGEQRRTSYSRQPTVERQQSATFRFGLDPGVAAMASLAIASWPLGEVDRAISLVDSAQERTASVTHISTQAYAKMYAAMFHLMRGDRRRAAGRARTQRALCAPRQCPTRGKPHARQCPVY
jgi:hypothetical protein